MKISSHFYSKTNVWFFFNSKRFIFWWWPEKKDETSNHCELLMVLVHDGVFNKYIESIPLETSGGKLGGYWKES